MKILHCNSSAATNQSTQEAKKKKLNPTQRNLLVSSVMAGIIIVVLLAWFTFRPDNKTNIHDYFSAEMVGELTTLQCRYHNVSVHDKEGGALGIGKQYVWFEYDVIVDVGIDVKQVKIEGPSDEGVIKIYLPPIEILEAKPDMSTIKKPVHDVAWGADLTTDEEHKIINAGSEKLKADAKTKEIITQAQESAKEVLEQYVMNVGKLVGEDYKVEWTKDSDNTQNDFGAPTDSTPK